MIRSISGYSAGGLISSGFLAIAAIGYSGLLVFLLVAALNAAPTAWQSMATLPFLATATAIACASAGLFILATVPFRAVAHFWAAGDALSRGDTPKRMSTRVAIGLMVVVVLFTLATILPALDGEFAHQPWISVAFQLTLLSGPAVLAALVLYADARMQRVQSERQGDKAS